MSLEAIVLVVIFTLLPLLEQLLRRWRETRAKQQRTPAPQRGTPPSQRPVPRQPAPAPPPLPRTSTPVPPIPRTPPGHMPLPEVPADFDEDEDIEELVVVRPPPVRRVPAPAVRRPPAPVARQTPARGPGVAAPSTAVRRRRPSWREVLHSRDGLARAVVLMTVLGPPRGLRAYGGPDASR